MRTPNKLLGKIALSTVFMLGTALAANVPSCNINNATNPGVCHGQVENINYSNGDNTLSFTLLGVSPQKSYNCKISIGGDSAQQVTLSNTGIVGSNGANVQQFGRTTNSIPFQVSNSTPNVIGMVQFTVKNLRQSFTKKEFNSVSVVCN